MWKFYAILAAVFAALTALFSKLGVKGVSGEFASAIRTSVALLFAWGIWLISSHGKIIEKTAAPVWKFLVLAGIATGLSWLFYLKALAAGPLSKVAAIDKLSVPLAIAMAFIFLEEPADLRTVIGASLIVAGTLVMVL
jgi:transporter family protein